MPIYEYQCKECEARFDLLRPMNASDDEVKCEFCGSTEVSKLLSAFAATGTVSNSGSIKSCPNYNGFT